MTTTDICPGCGRTTNHHFTCMVARATPIKHGIGSDHFSKKIQRALLRKGIQITGLTTIPGIDPFTGQASYMYNTQTGYLLNDNGTGRVVGYFDIEALAA